MSAEPARKELSFWPGMFVIAVVVPGVFYLKFGRIDAFALAFTCFLLLLVFGIEFVPKLNERFGADLAEHPVRPGRFDKLGVVWLLSIPFAPFLVWLLSSYVWLDRGNWQVLLGIRTGLCVALPCICVLPLLRYVRGRASSYALLILFLGTAFPFLTGWSSMMDLFHRPRWEQVRIEKLHERYTVVHYRAIPTGIVDARLSDGRLLEFNRRLVHIVSEGPARVEILESLGVIIGYDEPSDGPRAVSDVKG